MTEHDRWWIAYCALGAGLLSRAPGIVLGLIVLVVWALVLVVVSLHTTSSPRLRLGRIVPTGAARWETIRQGRSAGNAETTRTDLTAVPDPSAQKTYSPVATPTPYRVPDKVAARAPVETVVRVSLSGVLWTTEELIEEIQRGITEYKNKHGDD